MDAYSLCPGGTGKKVKFCCNDLLGDLQKIGKAIAGEQYLGALRHVDSLLAKPKYADRACLLAIRGGLLRQTEQFEEAESNARRFVEQHPENPIARAEAALLAAGRNEPREAIDQFQTAMEHSSAELEIRVYEAMRAVAITMIRNGLIPSAAALVKLQLSANPDDAEAQELWGAFCQAPNTPTLLKSGPPLGPLPGDEAPWKDRLVDALEPARMGRWRQTAQRLAALAAEVPDAPAIWSRLAEVRGWLADTEGCIEAVRRFAALDVPLEDAVEAEAFGMLLSADPLGDQRDVLGLSFTVHDPDRLHEALLSDSRILTLSHEPSLRTDDAPPPKWVGAFRDRPAIDGSEATGREDIPRIVGQAVLHGRQTDREARLNVISVMEKDQSAVETLLEEIAGGAVATPPEREVLGKRSQTRELVWPRLESLDDADAEQRARLADEHVRRAMLESWPHLKLGMLEGNCPAEVADDPRFRIRLLAAIFHVEHHLINGTAARFDANRLRAQLGLPTLDPIDPEGVDVAAVRPTRMDRIVADRLDDEQLRIAYRKAVAFRLRHAQRNFAEEFIRRPEYPDRQLRLTAYATLAGTAENMDEALRHVEEGRQAGLAEGASCASWDFMELRLRVAQRDGDRAMRLVEHIETRHIEEPGVAESLTSFLVEIGALRPDGTPAPMTPPAPGSAEAPAEPEPGKLWTPDSAQAGSQGGKLWTPD